MTATQMAKQVLTQLNQQPMTLVKTSPKPIFVIRVPNKLSNSEMYEIQKTIAKDNIKDDYHVLVVPAPTDEFMFEMFNADKIDVQQWNGIVDKFIK
jgi:predicted Zn-ribbon and HTH transcriptional regulator